MPLETQTVAGAAQFTGAAGLGLFPFTALASFVADNNRAIIFSVVCTCQGAAPRVQILRGLAATPAAERQVLVDAVGNSVGYFCKHISPKDAANNPFQYFVITTGKTGDGRAELDWIPGVVGAG